MRSVMHKLGWLLVTALVMAAAAIGCSKHHGRKGGTFAFVGAADANPQKEHSLIKNIDFNDGTSLPWTLSFSDPAKGFAAVENGGYCLHVENKGVNKWDASSSSPGNGDLKRATLTRSHSRFGRTKRRVPASRSGWSVRPIESIGFRSYLSTLSQRQSPISSR